MDLSKLIANENKKIRRVGRGTGCGRGKTCGRGNKGAGQRKGKVLPYLGFCGGNLSFLRRLPKKGFNSPNLEECQIVNLVDIAQRLKGVSEINPLALKEHNLIKDENKPVKLLAKIEDKKFSFKANFKLDSFSAKAKELIEAAGGKIITKEAEKKQGKKEKKGKK